MHNQHIHIIGINIRQARHEKIYEIKEKRMDNQRFKNSSLHNNASDNQVYENNDEDSAIENNKNDLVSNQGSSGISDLNIKGTLSNFEKNYLIRKDRLDRDEENPMYDATDEPFGPPDRF